MEEDQLMETERQKNYPRRIFILLSLFAALAFIAILKVTKGIAVQIILSISFSEETRNCFRRLLMSGR